MPVTPANILEAGTHSLCCGTPGVGHGEEGSGGWAGVVYLSLKKASSISKTLAFWEAAFTPFSPAHLLGWRGGLTGEEEEPPSPSPTLHIFLHHLPLSLQERHPAASFSIPA